MGKKIEESDFSLNASPFTPSSSLFASLFSDKRTKEKKNNGAQSSLSPLPSYVCLGVFAFFSPRTEIVLFHAKNKGKMCTQQDLTSPG